jgi:hypothetical protein
MCIKWINKGNWPKMEGINAGIFIINSVKTGLEVDQCIDIILSDFKFLNYFNISIFGASKLNLALRNKKGM